MREEPAGHPPGRVPELGLGLESRDENGFVHPLTQQSATEHTAFYAGLGLGAGAFLECAAVCQMGADRPHPALPPQPPPVPRRACNSPRTQSRGKVQQCVDQSHLQGAQAVGTETGLRWAGNRASSRPEKPEDRGLQRAVQATVKGLLCAGILQKSFRMSPITMLGARHPNPDGAEENTPRLSQVKLRAQLFSPASLSDLCRWPPMSAKAPVSVGPAPPSPQGS